MKKQLNKNLIERFSRQIVLKDIGILGQKKILSAKVLVVGIGGLGCPAVEFLTRAGIGSLGIADYDKVSLSNLHRQSLYEKSDVGKSKVLIVGAGGLGSPISIYLAALGIGKIGIVDKDNVEISNLTRQIIFTTNDIKKSKSSKKKIAQVDAQLNDLMRGLKENYNKQEKAMNDLLESSISTVRSENFTVTSGIAGIIMILIGGMIIGASFMQAKDIVAAKEDYANTEDDKETPIEEYLNSQKLLQAKLLKANLSEANLSEADLSGTNLSGVNLSNVNLSGANLSGTNLS